MFVKTVSPLQKGQAVFIIYTKGVGVSHILGKNEGMYNPGFKFAFTNITETDFVSQWNGVPITVKAGQTVTLPHHLADKMTDELVNKIIIEQVKLNETEFYKNNINAAPNTYRAPNSLGVPAVRQLWEDKIVRKLQVDEETPEIQVMRAQIRDELMADLSKEVSKEPPRVPSLEEFAEIKQGGVSPVEAPKAVNKGGRPKKLITPNETITPTAS